MRLDWALSASTRLPNLARRCLHVFRTATVGFEIVLNGFGLPWAFRANLGRESEPDTLSPKRLFQLKTPGDRAALLSAVASQGEPVALRALLGGTDNPVLPRHSASCLSCGVQSLD